MTLCKQGFKAAVACALASVMMLGATACGLQSESSTPQAPSAAAGASSSTASADSSEEQQKAYENALSGEGIASSFIGEQFYDGTIADENDALAAVESVMKRIGGDDTTELELMAIRPTEDDVTYYVFRQRAGDVVVRGASVKLVVNKDGKAIGLVSAIMPNIQLESMDTWGITQEQAEQAVLDECASEDAGSIKIVAGSTEQTVIPLQEGEGAHRYAWVVYTNNYRNDTDAAYLAHYVGEDGEYLYAIGASEPGDNSSLAGDASAFAFDGLENDTWTGTVVKNDGSTLDVTVPTLRDPETGDVCLADGQRKILCADFAAFTYGDSIAPRTMADGTFASNEVLTYDCFIRVWDFYSAIGWTGPDGEGTPSLLLMDMVTEAGDPIDNAYYAGRKWGFQCFAFNRNDPDGECTDVIAHEFTHCVTTTTMTANMYLNDYGAINEGMSDIMGNLIEILIDHDETGAWLIGEDEGHDVPYRSMKDPHAHHQPEYAWDMYYGAPVSTGTSANDYGGAHTNSSLLCIVSYKLDQAGMQPADQFFFWMNVALAMTPLTDYPQMAELLPWCMEQAGYPQYIDTLKDAIEQAKYTLTEPPSTLPEGAGAARIQLPDAAFAESENMLFSATPAEGDGSDITSAWPAGKTGTTTIVLPAGEYLIYAERYDDDNVVATWVYADSSWKPVTDGSIFDSGSICAIDVGATLDLPTAGLDG